MLIRHIMVVLIIASACPAVYGQRRPRDTAPGTPGVKARPDHASDQIKFVLRTKTTLPGNDFRWPRRLFAYHGNLCVSSVNELRVYSVSQKRWITPLLPTRGGFLDDQGRLALLNLDNTIDVGQLVDNHVRQISQLNWPDDLPSLYGGAEFNPWSDGLRHVSVIDYTDFGKDTQNATLYVSDLKSHRIVARVDLDTMSSCPTLQSILLQGGRYAVTGNWRQARVYDLQHHRVYMTLPPVELKEEQDTYFPRRFSANAEGTLLLSHAGYWVDASGPRKLQCFDLPARKQKWSIDLRKLGLRTGYVRSMFSTEGRYIIVGTQQEIALLSVEDGSVLGRIPVKNWRVVSIAQGDDGTIYAVGSTSHEYKPGTPNPPLVLAIFARQASPASPATAPAHR